MCKIIHKVVVIAAVVIAVALAILIGAWHDQSMTYVVSATRIFDVMLPVLAVGALFKYLFTYGGSCCSNGNCGCTPEIPKAAPRSRSKKK